MDASRSSSSQQSRNFRSNDLMTSPSQDDLVFNEVYLRLQEIGYQTFEQIQFNTKRLSQRSYSSVETAPLMTHSHATGNTSYHIDEFGDTFLHRAAINQDIQGAKNYLANAQSDAELNIQNNLGQTALHIAVEVNNRQLVQLYLCHGASASIFNNKGYTPIHRVCINGNYELLKVFQESLRKEQLAQEINRRDCDRRIGIGRGAGCLLLFVVNVKPKRQDDLNFIALLADCGAELNQRDTVAGMAVVHHAAQEDNKELYKYLMNHYEDRIDFDLRRNDDCKVNYEQNPEILSLTAD